MATEPVADQSTVMVDSNQDEAIRSKLIAERKFNARDFRGARKFALKAQRLSPSIDGIAQMVATFDVYLAAERKINGESDWYGVLSLNAFADEETVKKQYRKMALQLHPDKNKSIGAEGAFKLISEAWSVLSEKTQKSLYDQKRRDHPVPNVVDGLYTYEKKSEKRHRRSSTVAAQSTVATHASHAVGVDTFWTSCNRCRMQYEYLRVYLNHNLLCPNCHNAFLAVETGYPCNGVDSSFSWSSKQHPSHSAVKNSYPSTSKISAVAETGHGGYQNDRNYNSYDNQSFHWDQPSRASGSTISSVYTSQPSERKKRRQDDGYAANLHGEGKSVRKAGRPAKGRRINGHCNDVTHCKVDVPGQMTKTGETVAAEPEKTNGVSADILKPKSSSRQSNVREQLSQIDLRSMMVKKTKDSLIKKLESWNVSALVKLITKDSSRDADDKVNVMLKNSLKLPKNSCQESMDRNAGGNRIMDPKRISQSIDVPDPDFHDFDKDRTERAFEGDQVWATYDSEDGMPRLYAFIQKVISRKPFKIRMSFLNCKSNIEFGPVNWVSSGFSKTCGDFRVSRYHVVETVNIFSHQMVWDKGPRGIFRVLPRKGDTWALYRNWSSSWNEFTPDDVIHKYEIVEIIDNYTEEEGVAVIPLLKVAGFKAVFHRHVDQKEVKRIPREEMFRFSHQVPSRLLTGDEGDNAPKGCHELDTAATPVELLKVITEVEEDSIADNTEQQ